MINNKLINYIRKRLIVFSVFIALIFLSGCSLNMFQGNANSVGNVNMTPRQISVSGGNTTDNIVEQVSSAIVGIESRLLNGYAIGSGVSIKAGGYIITNQHVVSGTRGLTIYFADKTSASATLVWQDRSIDLAIIKSAKDMPYLECETNGVLQGEDVIAIGTPLSIAFQHSVTKGIVSAVNRTVEIENDDGSIQYMQNLIQHDASINPGNSGGPLINSYGKVIGINTLKASEAEGMGFAIPITSGQTIVEKLSANNSYSAPYVGVLGLESAYARAKKYQFDGEGLYIIGVDKNSVAGKSGIIAGDVIYKIDNTKINSFLDLRNKLYTHEVGDLVTIYANRNGELIEYNIVLGSR